MGLYISLGGMFLFNSPLKAKNVILLIFELCSIYQSNGFIFIQIPFHLLCFQCNLSIYSVVTFPMYDLQCNKKT